MTGRQRTTPRLLLQIVAWTLYLAGFFLLLSGVCVSAVALKFDQARKLPLAAAVVALAILGALALWFGLRLLKKLGEDDPTC